MSFCNTCLVNWNNTMNIVIGIKVYHTRECLTCGGEILICRKCMVGTMESNYSFNTPTSLSTKYELKRLTCCRSCERETKLESIGI